LAAVLALAAYLSTLQWDINGSQSPYATDVGEIQNALPRWGTIHFTGYPLYTVLGSIVVAASRAIGLTPAAGTSLVSALWGALAVGWLTWFLIDLGAEPHLAFLSSLLVGLSTSFWIDASIAEVHTLTLVWIIASLHFAWRFGRSGERKDWLWLVFAVSQGVTHQRAVVFAAPAVLALIGARWREPLRWRWLWPTLAVALAGPLTYLYLVRRGLRGASWTFNSPETWEGFWGLVLDTKAERIVSMPTSLGDLVQRLKLTCSLLADDLPLWALGPALLALLLPARRLGWRVSLSLMLLAALHILPSLIIWEGYVSDALLAVKLPAVMAAGMGLALGLSEVSRGHRLRRATGRLALAAMTLFTALNVRPVVLAITRDPAAETVIATAEAVDPDDGPPITFMALWGHDYWALTYAQAFRDQLDDVQLVDHNAPFGEILDGGERLVTFEWTLYERPPEWWAEELGVEDVNLSSHWPHIVEIAGEPTLKPSVTSGPLLDLENGVQVLAAHLAWDGPQRLVISIKWRAAEPVAHDYSVAVHLLAQQPPTGPQDILAQADRAHPVYGWYPTTQWEQGEVVADTYMLSVPAGTLPAGTLPAESAPVGVRVGMYRVNAQGGFENSPWLYLPLP
jgi:hypothetical protein